MSYLDKYKARVNAWGATEAEQFQNFGIQNFEEFLKSSPSQVEISYQGNTILGTTYEHNRREYTEVTNYLLTRLTEPVGIGTIFEDSYSRSWMILVQENITPPSYNRYKTIECNKVIHWDDEYGVAQQTPCYFVSSLDTKLKAIFDVANQVLIPQKNDMITIIMPYRPIAKDQRFIIANKAWKTTGIDYVSVDGIMFVTLAADFINSQIDDIQNQIADTTKDIWTIELKTDHYKQTVGSNFEIDYVVYHNGIVVTEPVTMISNNNYVTVNGNNTITAVALG